MCGAYQLNAERTGCHWHTVCLYTLLMYLIFAGAPCSCCYTFFIGGVLFSCCCTFFLLMCLVHSAVSCLADVPYSCCCHLLFLLDIRCFFCSTFFVLPTIQSTAHEGGASPRLAELRRGLVGAARRLRQVRGLVDGDAGGRARPFVGPLRGSREGVPRGGPTR